MSTESNQTQSLEMKRGSFSDLLVLISFSIVGLVIPLGIYYQGYFPPDDALRHAAKAVVDKPWDQILVFRAGASADTHPGWHWMGLEFDEVFENVVDWTGWKKSAVSAMLGVSMLIICTSDLGGRWSEHFSPQRLAYNEYPERLQDFFPGEDGIFYNVDMQLFYYSFFANPRADWRYMVGYEPALMPQDDVKIYRAIRQSGSQPAAYKPWVQQLRPRDRLVIRRDPGSPPNIPELEWQYMGNKLWFGRTPRVRE